MICAYKLDRLKNLDTDNEILKKIKFIDSYDTIDFSINIFIVHMDDLNEILDKVVRTKIIVVDDEYNLGNYLEVVDQNILYYIPLSEVKVEDFDDVFDKLLPKENDDSTMPESIIIDDQLNKVILYGETINLTSKEMKVFEYLNDHRGKLCLRKSILVDVLKYHPSSDSRIVDVYIRYIRNKLGTEGKKIKTIRGKGYVYESS